VNSRVIRIRAQRSLPVLGLHLRCNDRIGAARYPSRGERSWRALVASAAESVAEARIAHRSGDKAYPLNGCLALRCSVHRPDVSRGA
jgi:hypothetical protein